MNEKKHIDIYAVGQIMGDALAEYCKEKGIDFSRMMHEVNTNEGVFILGLMDSLGWAKKE